MYFGVGVLNAVTISFFITVTETSALNYMLDEQKNLEIVIGIGVSAM